VLDVRYDPASSSGLVRVRRGESRRTRRLSSQAVAEYDRTGRLLTIAITDLDATAAEFLRTADEETLLRVIAAQAGAQKAGRGLRDLQRGTDARPPGAGAAAKPRSRPKAAPAAGGDAAAKPKPRPRRKGRPGAGEGTATAKPPAADEAAKPKARRRRRPSQRRPTP
jgi:hypothetical protein